MQSKKVIWIEIALIAILLIFHNSMYPLHQSDQQSGVVLHALNRFFTANGLHVVFTQFEVRKLAHFIEYLIFGFLLTVAIRMIWKKRNGFFFFELFFFLVFPVVDETIQLHYPGRSSSVRDILIDFAGCVIGMGLCRLIFRDRGSNTANAVIPEKAAGPGNGRLKRRVLTVLTVAFTLFIFHNSMFPGPQSGSQSHYVTELLDHILAALRSPVTLSEHFVWKAGHFTEYFALGFLMTAAVGSYGRPPKKLVFSLLFFLLLVPVLDEFIQLFTPQRGSSVLDVLLDFGGGIAGMLLCWLIVRLRQHHCSNARLSD